MQNTELKKYSFFNEISLKYKETKFPNMTDRDRMQKNIPLSKKMRNF